MCDKIISVELPYSVTLVLLSQPVLGHCNARQGMINIEIWNEITDKSLEKNPLKT